MELDSLKIVELNGKYRYRLIALSKRMLGDEDTAEEVVQDALLIVYKKFSDFRGDSDIYTWMYRITVNLCLKAKSSLNKQRIRIADAEMENFDATADFLGQQELSTWKNNPELNYLYNELLESVKRECHFVLLGLLTKEQRIVYLMRTHEKMSFKEIGRILEIGENAAKSRMSRAASIIEKDLRSRCSLCNSRGYCSCDTCASYIIYKHPEILKKIREK